MVTDTGLKPAGRATVDDKDFAWAIAEALIEQGEIVTVVPAGTGSDDSWVVHRAEWE